MITKAPYGLEVGFIQAPMTVLGPGRRVGLWLRGCDRACPECMSDDLWEAGLESWQPVEKLFAEIERLKRETNATGLTISGGEPFLQAEGLRSLLILGQAAGWSDVLVYSGYLMKELLAANPWLPELVTAVVDGAYEKNIPSREPWRGSANQRLTLFRPKLAELYEEWQHDEKRKVQIITSESGVMRLLGIPGQGDFERLRDKLKGFQRHVKNDKTL